MGQETNTWEDRESPSFGRFRCTNSHRFSKRSLLQGHVVEALWRECDEGGRLFPDGRWEHQSAYDAYTGEAMYPRFLNLQGPSPAVCFRQPMEFVADHPFLFLIRRRRWMSLSSQVGWPTLWPKTKQTNSNSKHVCVNDENDLCTETLNSVRYSARESEHKCLQSENCSYHTLQASIIIVLAEQNHKYHQCEVWLNLW